MFQWQINSRKIQNFVNYDDFLQSGQQPETLITLYERRVSLNQEIEKQEIHMHYCSISFCFTLVLR